MSLEETKSTYTIARLMSCAHWRWSSVNSSSISGILALTTVYKINPETRSCSSGVRGNTLAECRCFAVGLRCMLDNDMAFPSRKTAKLTLIKRWELDHVYRTISTWCSRVTRVNNSNQISQVAKLYKFGHHEGMEVIKCSQLVNSVFEIYLIAFVISVRSVKVIAI